MAHVEVLYQQVLLAAAGERNGVHLLHLHWLQDSAVFKRMNIVEMVVSTDLVRSSASGFGHAI